MMPLEPRAVSGILPQESLGSLRSCLVEGDAEQRHRERHVRRRALFFSILIQIAALALLILIPLFAKTERIALAKNYIPIPPYGRPSSHPQGERRPANSRPANPGSRFTFDTPVRPLAQQLGGSSVDVNPAIDPIGNSPGEGPGCIGCVDIRVNSSGPRPPQPVVETPSRPSVIHKTTIDPAML